MQQQVEIQQDITLKTRTKLKNEGWKDIGGLKPATKEELKILKGIIYLFVNQINNKKLVGQTNNTFYKRYKSNWVNKASNKHFKHALTKYGKNNFKVFILEFDKNDIELNKLEIFYIKKFKSNNPKFGYNKTKGGKDNHYYPSRNPKIKQSFFEKAALLHKDKYSYQNSEYRGISEKIKIHCNKCDIDFWQTANNHLTFNGGCPKCRVDNYGNWCRSTKLEFIKKAKIIHNNKYNYDKINYINSNTKVEIYCNSCKNYFWQKPNSHLNRNGCRTCGQKIKISKLSGTKEYFEIRAKFIHGNKYSYNNFVYKNAHFKSNIKCNLCDGIFNQSPHNHFHLKNCPLCSRDNGYHKPMNKSIVQIDLKTNSTINIFDTLNLAKQFCKTNKIKNYGHIVSVCNGHRKSAGGYKWKYID